MNGTKAFRVFLVAASCASLVLWGDPGNPADQNYGDGTFGAVSATCKISKYEVRNAQYVEFLNAVDPTGVNPDLGAGRTTRSTTPG